MIFTLKMALYKLSFCLAASFPGLSLIFMGKEDIKD
jgi:hypothetical protein